MNKKQLSFGLAGLLVFIWMVLRDVGKTKRWHDFFVAPPPKPCKLLEKANPLSITKETNQRIKGVQRFQSEQVRCSLFEDMAKNINQAHLEDVPKVETEPIQSPKQVAIKPKNVVQKVNKVVDPIKQEKITFLYPLKEKAEKRLQKQTIVLFQVMSMAHRSLNMGEVLKYVSKKLLLTKVRKYPKGHFYMGSLLLERKGCFLN